MSEAFSDGPSDHLNLRLVERPGGLLEAALVGELSFATSKPPLELLMDAIERGETRLVLDLKELGFCDSAGLHMLVRLHEAAGSAGGWLRLVNVPDQVLRIIKATNLDQLLDAQGEPRRQ
ncbi:STAS domain-containing protein [Allorhizocola rhizosphaerae]|uniref:STAS domain-containing protein n=1 Tax=Allorhizocola rhizosphaerae TaxID=1872709 RepID=UPI000E3DBEE7|nr:STAS domain-containing protein [Allorhizocola rhizosphaerae]